MPRAAKNRTEAALWHLAISLLVVGAVFLVIYLLWYPPPLFGGAGGRDLFLVLALVDVTIGPLITFIIYAPGKRGLRFDLAVIGILQVAALAFGAHVVYQARPVWIVFAEDRFDVIRANQLVPKAIEMAPERFRVVSSTGPRLAAARQPDDPAERFSISVSALEGLDITSFPDLYFDYDEARSQVVAKARPLAELRKLNPGREPEIAGLAAQLGRPEAELAFLPARAGKNDLSVLVDAKSGEVLRIVDLKPWDH